MKKQLYRAEKVLLLFFVFLFLLTFLFPSSVFKIVKADNATDKVVKYDGSGNRHAVVSNVWLQRTNSNVSPNYTVYGNYFLNYALTQAEQMQCSVSTRAFGGINLGNFQFGYGGGSSDPQIPASKWSSWCGLSGNAPVWGIPSLVVVSTSATSSLWGINVTSNSAVYRLF